MTEYRRMNEGACPETLRGSPLFLPEQKREERDTPVGEGKRLHPEILSQIDGNRVTGNENEDPPSGKGRPAVGQDPPIQFSLRRIVSTSIGTLGVVPAAVGAR